MPITAALRLTLFSTLLATAMRAQALQLDITGGSMPGTLAMDAYPEAHPLDLMLIVPSGNSGPTPLSAIDPLDPRFASVGIDLLGSLWWGVTGIDGHLRVNVPLAYDMSLIDAPLFVQALTLQFTPTLFDRLSNPNIVRFAPAAAFRDRGLSFFNARAFATVLPRADRRWMICGGGTGLLLAQVADQTTEIYDPLTDSWAYGPGMTVPRSIHTATKLPNGKWLLAGGVGVNNDPQAACELYDPTLDTFTASAPMLVPRMGHTATLLPNGKVFVSGGLVALTVTPSPVFAIYDTTNLTEIYDPATNVWSAGPNLLTPRAGHIAMLRPDGKVLLAGGISYDLLPTVRRTCDLYDPVAGTMVAGPQMTRPRSLTDPVQIDTNRWLLAGGITSLSLTNQGTPTNTAEIYNAATNTWTAVGSMVTDRGNSKAWALGGGLFLLAGGANGTIFSPVPLASTEVFSTATNAFTPGPAMNHARAGAASFLTPNGQVQLFGGASTGGSITNSTEWYYF